MDTLVEQSANTLSAAATAPNGHPKDGSGMQRSVSPKRRSHAYKMYKGAVKLDPWLSPFEGVLKRRFSNAQGWIDHLDKTEGGLDKFSKVGEYTGSRDSLDWATTRWTYLLTFAIDLGCREIRVQHRLREQRHVQRMGPERHRSLSHRRLQ